jgi:hypothetical protein
LVQPLSAHPDHQQQGACAEWWAVRVLLHRVLGDAAGRKEHCLAREGEVCYAACRWDGSLGARMEIGSLDPAEFEDWREPPPSEEEEEAAEVEGGDGSEGGQTNDGDGPGGGATVSEADEHGVEGGARVGLPPHPAVQPGAELREEGTSM